HAYLFTGTRGVGKTTLARILARCLNCEEGISSRPCGTCEACREISEGRFIDLIEVDAASRTKVEDTRELLENVQYAPSRGRFKIYLIDEVHMLSAHSFNALLKTLEEPPPHVKFLLATTDPQKLPITILSRCLQFNLKNLSPQQIEEYLEDILGREKLDFEEAALWQLANAAAGSMRDALTLLDQAISFCEGEVSAAGVSDMLGTPEQGVVWRLLENLAAQDPAALLQSVQEVAERAPDFQQLLDAMLAVLHRLAIAQTLPAAIDNSFGDRDQVLEFAGKFSPEEIQLFYQLALKGRGDLNLAPDSRAMFEMLLIRMLVFAPEGTPTLPRRRSNDSGESRAEETVAEPDRQEDRQRAGPEPETQTRDGDRKAAARLPEEEPGKQKKKPLKRADQAVRTHLAGNTDSPVSVEKSPPTDRTSTAAEQQLTLATAGGRQRPDSNAKAEATALPVAPMALDNRNWSSLYQHLNPGGITGNIMAHCVIVETSEQALRLCLDSSQSAVFNEEHRTRIEQLLAGHFQTVLELTIEVGEPASESPALRSQRIKREKLEQLRNRFEQDDNVRQLVETFSGEILTESISPIEQRG
ncbi:MAG: DNA polymerase III subunit gamma/tau, partial [Pseudomonadales bacterium]|nr:DNA polymerase III subunit gamma/tau [Pseudomonadales bacterium]